MSPISLHKADSSHELSPPSLDPRLDSIVIVQGGSDVEVKGHIPWVVRVGFTTIKVDDIPYLRPTSIDDPIVSVERRSVANVVSPALRVMAQRLSTLLNGQDAVLDP